MVGKGLDMCPQNEFLLHFLKATTLEHGDDMYMGEYKVTMQRCIPSLGVLEITQSCEAEGVKGWSAQYIQFRRRPSWQMIPTNLMLTDGLYGCKCTIIARPGG